MCACMPVCLCVCLCVCVSIQGHFPKMFLSLCPLFLAAFVSMTRVADYKHDFSDVNAGM